MSKPNGMTKVQYALFVVTEGLKRHELKELTGISDEVQLDRIWTEVFSVRQLFRFVTKDSGPSPTDDNAGPGPEYQAVATEIENLIKTGNGSLKVAERLEDMCSMIVDSYEERIVALEEKQKY